MDTATLDTIRLLRADAERLASFHEHYQATYNADSRCDKKGYGFGRDNRFAAFEVKTSFDALAGYYGDSSCAAVLRFEKRETVGKYLVRAMNVHQKVLFDTAARLMREDAAKLREKAAAELAALQKMLDEASEAAARGVEAEG